MGKLPVIGVGKTALLKLIRIIISLDHALNVFAPKSVLRTTEDFGTNAKGSRHSFTAFKSNEIIKRCH